MFAESELTPVLTLGAWHLVYLVPLVFAGYLTVQYGKSTWQFVWNNKKNIGQIGGAISSVLCVIFMIANGVMDKGFIPNLIQHKDANGNIVQEESGRSGPSLDSMFPGGWMQLYHTLEGLTYFESRLQAIEAFADSKPHDALPVAGYDLLCKTFLASENDEQTAKQILRAKDAVQPYLVAFVNDESSSEDTAVGDGKSGTLVAMDSPQKGAN